MYVINIYVVKLDLKKKNIIEDVFLLDTFAIEQEDYFILETDRFIYISRACRSMPVLFDDL